ncbi:hypothetical protein OG235_36700 [Streptomyces sp. NBC_00024]|uniref:hypothetical protein n=1 Tax=Streptomyces sp. NBC_00024 TaxID=2903612 RepID=UPI0032485BB2
MSNCTDQARPDDPYGLESLARAQAGRVAALHRQCHEDYTDAAPARDRTRVEAGVRTAREHCTDALEAGGAQ